MPGAPGCRGGGGREVKGAAAPAGPSDTLELGDAAVVPTGLLISLVVVLILLYTGWRGWEMVYQHRVGVSDQPT